MMKNEMCLEFDSISANEAFARVTVAAFMTQMNPSMEEVADVKTAVSEAVTNAIIHGYEGEVHKIVIRGRIDGEWLELSVEDRGESLMWKKPWSLCIPPARSWNVPAWDFFSWRHLWMK